MAALEARYRATKLRYLARKNAMLEVELRERGLQLPELNYDSSSSDSDWEQVTGMGIGEEWHGSAIVIVTGVPSMERARGQYCWEVAGLILGRNSRCEKWQGLLFSIILGL